MFFCFFFVQFHFYTPKIVIQSRRFPQFIYHTIDHLESNCYPGEQRWRWGVIGMVCTHAGLGPGDRLVPATTKQLHH